jgi:hypothetical protein
MQVLDQLDPGFPPGFHRLLHHRKFNHLFATASNLPFLRLSIASPLSASHGLPHGESSMANEESHVNAIV